MKKNKLNFRILIKVKEPRIILGIISVVFIFFTALFLKSIKQPLQYQQKIASNNITQKTNINYSTESLPEGMKSIDGTIFSKIQDNLYVHVNSIVNSEKVVSIVGKGRVYYDIIAEGLWSYSMPISEEMNLELSGTENTLIDSSFQIKLEDVNNIINETISKISGSGAGKYILTIRPDFQGNILYENKTIPLENQYTLSFEYSNGLLKKIEGENEEFNSNIPIETLTVKNNEFNFLGISLPLKLARYLFSAASLILLIIIIKYLRNFKVNKRSSMQAVSYIDKKYKNRIVFLYNEPSFQDKILLPLINFKDLIRIADERNLSILKYYKNNSAIAMYAVIDGECIYNYFLSSTGEVVNKNTDGFTLGSDIFNG